MGPLDGIRVLDFSRDVAANFCTKLMASFGAQVTKVEQLRGDPIRCLGPLVADDEGQQQSPFFLYLNSGKRGIALDTDHEEAATLLQRLAAGSDVIVKSALGAPEAAGCLATEALTAAAPRAIIVDVSAYGQDGPWAGRPSNDLIAYAQSGWASVNGEPGRPPLKGSGYQASFQGGIAAFLATMGELLRRQGSGDAQSSAIDVSVLDALIVTFAPALLQVQFNGRDSGRRPAAFPTAPVRASDGYFVLTTSRAHFWRDAMNELGLPDLAVDERFDDPSGRQELYAEVAPIVEERIGRRKRDELFHALGTLRVSGGMVLEVDELFDDPQLCAREFFEPLESPGLGTLRYPGAPFKLPASPWETPFAAPALGQHTDEILSEAGVSETEIAHLRGRGVVA